MNRTVSGLCLAAALGLATTLGAQSTTTTPGQPAATTADREVTMTGCLSKSAAGGFMLNNAHIDPTPSSTTTTAGSTSTTTAGGATTTAGATTSTTTAGATGTTGGNPANSPAMSWMLSGDSDLEKHLGHKIQVTGKTSWKGPMDQGRASTTTATTSTTTASTTTAGAASDQPRLDVKSIKMVSATCS
jgi:hypothetical protein